ncbi:LPS export ABC transporter permease LptF [Paracoccus sp. (in: a-proteobacteria)]|uniref:LPS export ABC transporter permease LptF n=1 Tax=Paracoccus sp. TaxID=267 RepID=UPI0026DF19A5|nr:LPS export ABC transporter permease LptF [Paracoccus sp. (in: a-proteobacteria)]MDO5648649.1 LPS export ABC transporter permease LptF [Paracoccus sp. (in: a-proteobacteria)]
MPRLDRYILIQMLTLFGFFALVLVSVYWINRAVRLFDELLNDGQTALVVLEFTALTLPIVMAIVLPVAAFAAAAYATNRLAGESELVAMQAAGVSPWRLARPVAVYGVLVGLMVAVLVHGLVPMAYSRLAERRAEIAESVTAQFLRPGAFQYPARDVTLFIRDIAADGRLLDLFIQDDRDAQNRVTYTATEALLVRLDTGPSLLLLDGMTQNMRIGDGQQRLSVTRFAELSYDIGRMMGGGGERGRDLRDYGTLRLLSPDDALLQATGATQDRAIAAAHDRIAQPFLAPIAAMIGFATLMIGGFSRFGVWRQVGWAVLCLLVVQFVSNAATSQVTREPAMWPVVYAPLLIGGALCLALLWLAGRPLRIKGAS